MLYLVDPWILKIQNKHLMTVLSETVSFVSPRPSMFLETKLRGTLRVDGKNRKQTAKKMMICVTPAGTQICRLQAVSLVLENRREERKTGERASVTVSVTCERRCRFPTPALLVRHAHRHARTATCFAFLPTDFRGICRGFKVHDLITCK